MDGHIFGKSFKINKKKINSWLKSHFKLDDLYKIFLFNCHPPCFRLCLITKKFE